MARRTVERLIRANRWPDITRGRKVPTTRSWPVHSRAPDVVNGISVRLARTLPPAVPTHSAGYVRDMAIEQSDGLLDGGTLR